MIFRKACSVAFQGVVVAFSCAITLAQAQTPTADASQPPRIHLIHMGGNDGLPCVNWRRFELPKLEKTEVFSKVKFSYVVKSIGSEVPSAFFLPADVKPYKDILDTADGANRGSPQAALIVNGQVYDYWFRARDAADIEKMLLAITGTGKYPFERCVKQSARWTCVDRG